MKARVVFGLLAAGLILTRLCHIDLLWAEETLPLAAAGQMLLGKTLYRDIWFDKPPLTTGVYLLWAAQTGWLLRLAGALYVLGVCALLYEFARRLWGEREGMLAAALSAFSLTFWIPSAVIPLAADLLMVAPHIAAVYLAWRGKALASGVVAGVAFLFNSKAVLVLAACAVFNWRALPWLVAGFAAPNVAALGWLAWRGSLASYWQQVWQVGSAYSADTFVERKFLNGAVRVANWAGFHAALVVAAVFCLWRDRSNQRWRMAVWAALSLIGVTLGWRFFPRYFFQLLPVVVLAAARGFFVAGKLWRVVILALLLIPLVRFGPRYVLLAADTMEGRRTSWVDLDMDSDSRDAAAALRGFAKPGDTLVVWGYRPEIFVYSDLNAATRFLESQPLTGVFADRHLTGTRPSIAEWTAAHRAELARSRPTFLVDGLGPYNPHLAVTEYPDLSNWLSLYAPVAGTRFTRIYRLRDGH
jgi:hypothetical protein